MIKGNVKIDRKNLISILQSCLALILVVLVALMMVEIGNLKGTARVINYAGLVRGDTQRAVKLEITGTRNDELIAYLDDILSDLTYGDGHYELVKLKDAAYQERLDIQRAYWERLKAEVAAARQRGKGFNVYYQPIMDCATETITGAEALMRFTMDSEEGPEVISPIEFIPLLEETGLIIPAGKFVLKEAAKMCREIRRFIPGFQMNINVSYAQIAGGNVEDDIIETIKEHALDPANICVEMTESRLIDMTIPFIRFRHKLKDSRIRFAIDDFGTGYSNLHCINDIKPDYIKIDRDFTAKAMNGQRDYELLKSIITMIHSVNAKICIEGIEQGKWRQEMGKMGADSLQGYFYGRPCNKSDFMAKYI